MRVGIIGIGAIAKIHIAALQDAKQEIAAICDVKIERCFGAVEKFGLSAKSYEDYMEMIDCEELDAVHICTPHHLHAEMICYALDRNVNVLCEKPIAINYGQLDMIRASAQKSKAQLGVCQQNRFKASMKYVKELFEGEEITSASGLLCWQRDKNYYLSEEWRGKKATEGGGVIINQALHTLDILQWLCGMPTSVIAHTFCDTLKEVIDVEETAFAIFKLSNGGRFVLNATNSNSYSFPITVMLHSRTKNVVVVDDNIICNGEFVTRSDGLPLFGKEVWGVGHLVLIKEYYRALTEGEKFDLDFDEAEKVVKLLLALYESEGKEIAIRG